VPVDDDYLVALAREHGVDRIVTGDKDLLEREYQQPPVITPAAFEELLDSQMPGGGGEFKSPSDTIRTETVSVGPIAGLTGATGPTVGLQDDVWS
jgi:hypothetical protein